MKSVLNMCVVAAALGCAAVLPAGAERTDGEFALRAESVLREEARGLHADLTSPHRWREWALERANGEDADFRAWMSSRWQETPGRLADGYAASLADWAGSGLRESGWVETLDFSFQLPLQGRAGRLSVNAVGPLLPGLAGGDSVLGWQLPLALGALEEEDGDAEVVGNFGLFYRRALGDSGLAGLNIFGDYQDAGADGGFWRWSVGAEYRTAWADVFANRYIPSSEARRSVLSGGREERIAYTAGGYDAEVRFHAPSSRWLEGFAEYSLWEGEYGDADEEGFRYGLRLSPATGGLADGFHLEADYDDAADGGLGARFSYDWTLGQRPRSRGYAAFDPRGHFFTPVERRHDQKIRVRIRSLDRDGFGAFARSAVAGACARGAGVELDTDADSAVNVSLIAEAEAGDYDGVCGALRNGASPNHPDFLDDLSDADEDWAMHYAAGLSSSSAVSILSALIGEGGDIDAPGEYEYTPLHSAIEAGAVEASRFLIISGANLRLSDDVGVRPLGAAGDALVVAEDSGLSVMAANVRRIITLLLAHSAECRRRFATRYGPEVRAVCAGKGYATPLLWEAGGAAYAASGHEGRVTLLREAFSGAGPEDFSPMYSAVAGGVFMVRGRDLEAGESLSPGVYSVTALVSAEQGRLEAATLYATLAVSVLSGGGAFTITASPYAKYPNGGGLATFAVSAAGLPSGLSLLYGKAGGSEELTLTAEGYARWEGDSARATVFAGYEMEVLAGAPWLAGTLSFSLTVSAACAAEAEHGDDVNMSRDIGLAAYYQELDTVCWLIGQNPEAATGAGYTPLHRAVAGLSGDRATRSIDTVNLLLAYGANVNARYGGSTPLDYVVNDRGGHVAALTRRLREAGGVCEYYDGFRYPTCGLNFESREFVKSVSHGWAESVLSVKVGVDSEATVAFYELEHSRLTVRKWEDGGEQGFEVSPLAGAPLLGGEHLTASVIVWAAEQTLTAALEVTVAYGGIEALSAADSVFTVAWNYQGDLFTVASGTGEVLLSYDPSAADASAALVSLSPFSSAWRWNGGADEGGPHAASVLVTLSRAHYATRTETTRVSIYAVTRPSDRILTASPYATGGLLTLSHPDFSGLVFEKVSGSAGLTVGSDGVVGWKSGVTAGVRTDHVLNAEATPAGMLGTLRFSAEISADCSSEAQYGANEGASGLDFEGALEADDASAVCWHVGHGRSADVDLALDYGVDARPLHLAAGSNATVAAALLLALGADADARDSEGWRPLHWAAYEDDGGGAVASLLLAAGADGNARAGAERQAPLHWAAEYGKTDVMSALLSDADILVNAGDESGWTPLHWAVDAGEEGSARLLLSDGRTEANAADDSGLSALDLAVKGRAEDMAEILRAGGGVCLDDGHSSRKSHMCGLRFWPRTAEVVGTVGQTGAAYTIAASTNTERGRTGGVASYATGVEGFTVSVVGGSGVLHSERSFRTSEVLVTVWSGSQTLVMSVALSVSVSSCPAGSASSAPPAAGATQAQLDAGLLSEARDNDLAGVCEYLRRGADIEAQESEWRYYKRTALMIAATDGHLDLAKLLRANGADVNRQGGNYHNSQDSEAPSNGNRRMSALHYASGAGHKDFVEWLLAEGADLHAKQTIKRDALWEAAFWGRVDIVKLFLSLGADVNARDVVGATPFLDTAHHSTYWARYGNQGWGISDGYAQPLDADWATVISLLVSHGTDVNVRYNHTGSSALDVAVSRGNAGSAELLRGYGVYCYVQTSSLCAYPPVTVSFSDPQHGALSARSGASVLTGGGVVEKGATVVFTATPDSGYYVSIWFGSCADAGEVADGLDGTAKSCAVAADSDLSVRAEFSEIPSLAGPLCSSGSLSANGMTQAQLDAGLISEAEGNDLAGACEYLRRGANVDARESGRYYKRTALMIAANDGFLDLAKLLHANGADVNLHGGSHDGGLYARGWSALHYAAVAGNVEIARLLLDAGAEIESVWDGGGKTALWEASYWGRPGIVELLLARGADVLGGIPGDLSGIRAAVRETTVNYPYTRTMLSYYYPKPSADSLLLVVSLLAAGGAELNERRRGGRSILDEAVNRNNARVAEVLRQFGGKCFLETGPLCAYPPVTVSFSDPQHGALSARSGASVLTGGDAVEKGATVVFTATPDAGYYVSGWSGDCANVGASGSGSDSGAKTCTVTANAALNAGAVFSAISPSTGWLDWSGDIPVNHLLRTGRGDEVAHVSKERSFSFPAPVFSRRFSPPRRQLSLRRYFEDWPILSSGGEANFSAG